MSTSTITVDGMTCNGCAKSVSAELKAVPGVTDVDIDLSNGTVTITSDAPIDDAAVKAAVEEAGYQLAG